MVMISNNLLVSSAICIGGFVWYMKQISQGKVTLPKKDSPYTIFITGAASGIGLETAKLFLKRGWFVGCFDMNEEGLRTLFQNEDSSRCFYAQMDVTSVDSCKNVLQQFVEKAGSIDCLFNCAGLLRVGKIDSYSLSQQTSQIDVNCTGIVNLTYLALPYLKSSQGRVITMASLSACGGVPNHSVYAATKSFVYSFTEGMRSECVDDRILFADVSAPYVNTPMVGNQEKSLLKGIITDKSNYIEAIDVAEKVWEATHYCNFYNEHFYCGDSKRIFKIFWLMRALGSSFHTRAILKANGLKPPSKL